MAGIADGLLGLDPSHRHIGDVNGCHPSQVRREVRDREHHIRMQFAQRTAVTVERGVELGIIDYYRQHAADGYRRLTYLMLDADVVAVSPATTYRVLREEGLLRQWNTTPSRKGQGCTQPLAPHEHWHIDIAHLKIAGTFY